jgi:hypothetical protein
MLRLRFLSNKFQKRLIRPLYGQTQAYPYAATLDPTFRATDGSLKFPTTANDTARTADAFSLKSGLVPGTVMILSAGAASAPTDSVKVANGFTDEQPFGILANFVGGDLDELGDENSVGVWRGPDGVFELLAPCFNPTGLVTAWTTRATPGAKVPLFVGSDGRLTVTARTVNSAAATTGTAVTVDFKV